MAVLEAMAAGVPVVAARVGGVPELIEDGRTGLLCEPLDGASMRRAVERVLASPVIASEIAAQARARARERFQPEAIAQRHAEVYALALTGHGGEDAAPAGYACGSDSGKQTKAAPADRSS